MNYQLSVEHLARDFMSFLRYRSETIYATASFISGHEISWWRDRTSQEKIVGLSTTAAVRFSFPSRDVEVVVEFWPTSDSDVGGVGIMLTEQYLCEVCQANDGTKNVIGEQRTGLETILPDNETEFFAQIYSRAESASKRLYAKRQLANAMFARQEQESELEDD